MIVYTVPDIPITTWPHNIFPVYKYELVRRGVSDNGFPVQPKLLPSPPLDMEQALAGHDGQYCLKLWEGTLSKVEQRRIGFPWSPNLLLRARHSAGATLAAARTALAQGISGALAGGTHHAHANYGFGFCLLNDLAITAKLLVRQQAVKRVAVVDLDFHPGDGTAQICRGDPNIYTFSLHGKSILSREPVGSNWDLELPWGIQDSDYLDLLGEALERVLVEFRPQLVLYQAGVDVLKGDILGRFNLSLKGVRGRDEMVFRMSREAGAAVAFTLGGGYHPRTEILVQAHLNTVHCASRVQQGLA